MFEKDLLKSKRVLITGGGTGLGRSIVDRYLALGADLVICGRREAILKEAADRFAREWGAQVETHVCDVRSADAVEAMMELIFARRPLDVLVNNAAGNFIAQTHKLSTRAVDAVLGIVLHGSAYCTIAAGRRWIEAGRGGTVLSILTLSALQGGAFTVPSAIAKAGVLAMTKSLAVEWGPKGIRLVAVAPGPFPTPGAWSRLMPQERQAADPKRGIPLRRYGEHIELANLCSYLVSDQAAYITGECVVIDGGKRHLAGSSDAGMLDWTDEFWSEIRERAKTDKS